MDTNGDGKLDKDEIKRGYLKYFNKHMTDDEIDKLFRKADIDANGYVDYAEFLVAAMEEKNLLSANKLQ